MVLPEPTFDISLEVKISNFKYSFVYKKNHLWNRLRVTVAEESQEHMISNKETNTCIEFRYNQKRSEMSYT